MKVDARELAWAAGLFEGEGCIHLSRLKTSAHPRMKLTMTDEDSVRRFHVAVGGLGAVRGPWSPGEGYKDAWDWSTAKFEHAQAVVAFLWYGLGQRRRAKCVEVLSGAEYRVILDRAHLCKNGHLRTPGTTITRPDGRRECRTCNQKTTRDSYRRLNSVPENNFRRLRSPS